MIRSLVKTGPIFRNPPFKTIVDETYGQCNDSRVDFINGKRDRNALKYFIFIRKHVMLKINVV